MGNQNPILLSTPTISGEIIPQNPISTGLTTDLILPLQGRYWCFSGVILETREEALACIHKKTDCQIAGATYSRKDAKSKHASHWKAFSLKFTSPTAFEEAKSMLAFLPEGVVCPDGYGNIHLCWVLDRDYESHEIATLLSDLRETFAGRATLTPHIPWNDLTRKNKYPGSTMPDRFKKGLSAALESLEQSKLVEVADTLAEAQKNVEATDEILRFIEAVAPDSGQITVRAFGINTGKGKKPIYDFFDSPSEAANYVKELPEGWDSYLATASFKDRSSAAEENFLRACSCPIDFDVAGKDKKADAKHYATKDQALRGMRHLKDELFGDMDDSPLVIVDSGNGIQAHVILSESVDAATRKRLGTKIEKFCMSLGEKPDPAVTKDVVRIMRIPGTFNHKGYKDGTPPKPTKCLEWHKANISPRDLEERLDALLGPELVLSSGMNGRAAGVDELNKKLMGYNEPFHLAQNKTAIESLLAFVDCENEDHWRWMLKLYNGSEEFPETKPEDLEWLWSKIMDWSRQSEDFESEDQQREKMRAQRSEHPRAVFSHFQNLGWKNPGSDKPSGVVQINSPELGLVSGEKKLVANLEMVSQALREPKILGMRFAYDEFLDEEVISEVEGDTWRPVTDGDIVDFRIRLEKTIFKNVSRELMRDARAHALRQNRVDLARLWASQLPAWDGIPRVSGFLTNYLGATDTDYEKSVSEYMWSALAGRCLVPGIKADMVPILVGAQGAMKSTAVAEISPSREFHCELDFGNNDDETKRMLRGRLVVELSELAGMNKKDKESLKKFLSATADDLRKNYAEKITRFQRRCVFIGTSNRDDFLDDETGNRRYLPVKVGVADIEAIKRERLQLWAEAIQIFTSRGIQYAAAESAAVHKHVEFEAPSIIQEQVERALKHKMFEGGTVCLENMEYFKLADVAIAMHLSAAEGDRLKFKIAAALKTLGYENKNARWETGKKPFRAWTKQCEVKVA
jgi:hypothetical protein